MINHNIKLYEIDPLSVRSFLYCVLNVTVMILSFRTPKTFVVITLKFELCGFTVD